MTSISDWIVSNLQSWVVVVDLTLWSDQVESFKFEPKRLQIHLSNRILRGKK